MEEKTKDKTLLRKIIVVFLALIGFVTTVKLAIIYYEANFDPYALPSFCSINSFIDCDGVAQTTHSQFFGIPLAYWGMFLYTFIIFLVFAPLLKKIKGLGFLEVFKNPLAYISALGLFAFFISMILAIISLFEIKKLCILCFFTYILNLVISIAATDFSIGFWANIKTSVIDFWDAIKIKKYLISFIIVALLGCGVLAFTSLSYCFTPQVKRYKSIKEFADMKTNPFMAYGNVLGDKNAKLKVDYYTDYKCPICPVENLMMHRAAKELSNVQFVHHNLPLDISCNKYLKQPFHQGSCLLARYAVAAHDQGKFLDINTALYDKQPKNEDAMLHLAKSMGFDTIKLRQDANSKATQESIEKDIDTATSLGIDGTPAMVINGKVFIGVKPYYELVSMLKKAGAVDRK